jgi:monoamine oxidase
VPCRKQLAAIDQEECAMTAGNRSPVAVAIVGAGAAGLYVAYRLLQASIPCIVLEADLHGGGRVHSRPEAHSHLGLVLDDGANLINSTDTLAIRLMNRFGIRYVRRVRPGADSMQYFVNGEHLDQAGLDSLLFRESRGAINCILLDQEEWRKDSKRDTNPKFIHQDIASYLDGCGADPFLRSLLRSFFWSEYGREIEELNLHVLFDYLAIDLSCPCFKLIPNVDEAYTVPGGTGQIVNALERSCRDSILYGHRVMRIDEIGGVIRITSCSNERIVTHAARQIFFAAPLHSLQRMTVSVKGLSPEALEQARSVTYARGTKLHLKFEQGFHDLYTYSGILLTDTGEQIWASSVGQGGAGLLTVLTGPMPDGQAIAVEHSGRILRILDRIRPSLSDLFVGVERSDAPMSYSGALRPGDVAHLAINDGGDHWTTVGEASSGELQGYLEGALRSAEDGVARFLHRKAQAYRQVVAERP